jgi:DNA polymerase-1
VSLAKLKKKIADQKAPMEEPKPIGIADTKMTTPTVMRSPRTQRTPKTEEAPKPQVVEPTPQPTSLPMNTRQKRTPRQAPKTDVALQPLAQAERLPNGLPKGYHPIGKNDVAQLMELKDKLINAKIASYDYETDGDPDDDTQDPQDHKLVGVSFACELGQAFYMPIGHITYGANWDVKWLVENFLRPVLMHPEVFVIAHNIKFEHQMNIVNGIDFFEKATKRMVMDTMLLIKALAMSEDVGALGEVVVGLKPATKAHLADKDGMVHGLLHIDEIKTFKETVGKKQVPIPGDFYKAGANKGKQKTKAVSRTFGELPIDKHTVDYACSDSDWALGLWLKLKDVLASEELDELLYELDVPFMLTLGEIELTGWKVEPSRLLAMREVAEKALDGYIDENGQEVEGLESKLWDALIAVTEGHAFLDDKGRLMVPSGVYDMGVHKGEMSYLRLKNTNEFSWGSNNALPWLFFHVLKMDTRGLARSKATGIPGTGKDNMELMIDGYEGDNAFIQVFKEKKKYDKILSTYVNGLLPFAREDTSKIHTNLNLVTTWRLSSKKPNLQNIPRADNDPIGIRNVFEAPTYDLTKDYSKQNIFTRPPEIMIRQSLSGETVYIFCDYSQIELKVLAWYAGEASMINTLANGGDLHSKVAHEVFKLDCTVEEVKNKFKPFRYRAKKINFGLVYGMTEFGLSKDRSMGMTKDEALAFINRYMATYPGVKEYSKGQIAFAREMGYVETMFGHRRPIPEINSGNKWIRQAGENKAMNTPIQGSASDIIRQAMVAIRVRSIEEAPYLRQVIQIHDEIGAEVPIEYASEGSKWLKSVMEAPVPGFSDIMPIIAEPAVGKIWGHALDIEWDTSGAFVTPKKVKKEATDVTIDEIQYMLPLYEKAGIEVRV